MSKVKDATILRYFNYKNVTECRIHIPTELAIKMEYMYYLAFESFTSLQMLRFIFFNFAFNVFFDLVENKKLKSLLALMRITRLIERTTKEFVENSQDEFPFIKISNLIFINDQFEKRKYNKETQQTFFHFLESKVKIIIEDRMLLDREDILDVFKMFEASKYSTKHINLKD